jgi:hypothetical protein
MNAACNILALLIAGGVTLGAAQAKAQAKNQFAFSHQGTLTNSTPVSISWALKYTQTAPQLTLGSRKQVTGLMMDCLAPWQTWNMLDPPAPVQAPQIPMPPLLAPVTSPGAVNDLAVHEPDFALIRLSFP